MNLVPFLKRSCFFCTCHTQQSLKSDVFFRVLWKGNSLFLLVLLVLIAICRKQNYSVFLSFYHPKPELSWRKSTSCAVCVRYSEHVPAPWSFSDFGWNIYVIYIIYSPELSQLFKFSLQSYLIPLGREIFFLWVFCPFILLAFLSILNILMFVFLSQTPQQILA